MTTLLVVEDDAAVRTNLQRFLGLEGYRVVVAENGARGEAMALAEKPDLILCDIMMPEVSGFEMLSRLRTNPEWTAVPVVFLTASADRNLRNVGLALGAGDYLIKPFTLADILALVRRRLKEV